MITTPFYPTANEAWLALLDATIGSSLRVAPRGLSSREVMGAGVRFPLDRPVVTSAERKVSYKFMAAEPIWMLAGSEDAAEIAEYNQNMLKYSDNGVHWGAYGPRFVKQLGYVADTLADDPSSRQAVMTFWRRDITDFILTENRPPKDVPCTIALSWLIRDGLLHTFAEMRSSDVWLGVPYDFFTFAILSYRVAQEVNRLANGLVAGFGELTFYAISEHLYESDLDKAIAAATMGAISPVSDPAPPWVLDPGLASRLNLSLVACRDRLDLGAVGEPIWRVRPRS